MAGPWSRGRFHGIRALRREKSVSGPDTRISLTHRVAGRPET
ncbi:hypothetical protein D779_4098 [Imhoffiella purpurea]|uniref:Uncharacterized protein n=1 Tax=Imhoffiella purpurea TaxID=1249627 RepID=W9W1R3_9GAMM|nr:hypothetical protein D779_4098 [Imhoffiella purpurea]